MAKRQFSEALIEFRKQRGLLASALGFCIFAGNALAAAPLGETRGAFSPGKPVWQSASEPPPHCALQNADAKNQAPRAVIEICAALCTESLSSRTDDSRRSVLEYRLLPSAFTHWLAQVLGTIEAPSASARVSSRLFRMYNEAKADLDKANASVEEALRRYRESGEEIRRLEVNWDNSFARREKRIRAIQEQADRLSEHAASRSTARAKAHARASLESSLKALGVSKISDQGMASDVIVTSLEGGLLDVQTTIGTTRLGLQFAPTPSQSLRLERVDFVSPSQPKAWAMACDRVGTLLKTSVSEAPLSFAQSLVEYEAIFRNKTREESLEVLKGITRKLIAARRPGNVAEAVRIATQIIANSAANLAALDWEKIQKIEKKMPIWQLREILLQDSVKILTKELKSALPAINLGEKERNDREIEDWIQKIRWPLTQLDFKLPHLRE